MTKRLFQILDEMNVNDEANKTATCACCFDLVGANKVKQGGHVTMGVPAEAVLKLLLGEYQPMLVLLDKKEYYRLEGQPVEMSEAEQRTATMAEVIEELMNIAYPNVPVLKKANQVLADYNTHKQSFTLKTNR